MLPLEIRGPLGMRIGVGPKWDCWQVMGPTEAFFWGHQGFEASDRLV